MSTAVVADAADLFAAARHCLDARDPDDKIALTGAYARRFRDGALPIDANAPAPGPIGMPGRPELSLIHI